MTRKMKIFESESDEFEEKKERSWKKEREFEIFNFVKNAK